MADTQRHRRARLIAAVGVLVSLALGLVACGDGTTPQPIGPEQTSAALAPDTVAALDAALADAVALAGASGAIAGVWAPWAGQWQASPGTVGTTVDPATGRPSGGGPLDTGMRFRIGTQTTAMTCTVLLRLVDEKRVGLDDPAARYLTRQPGIDGITLRQLCQQTSGLGEPDLAAQFVNNPTRVWPPLEVISSGLGATRAGEPGEVWSRSDAGVQLLGMALEAATGETWPTLYDRYLFGPLRLGDTSFPAARDLDVPGPHPHGWAATRAADGRPDCNRMLDVSRLSTSMSGVAGGVVSTLGDLRTWSRALATGSLLSAQSAAEQWQTVPESGVADWRRYGLGAEQVGPLRGAAGQIPGYLSATLSDPESGLTVVVLVNESSAGADFALDLARRLAAIAARAPASDGQAAPDLDLPWSADDAAAAMRVNAVCPAGTADQAVPAG
jgi:D-alanyl-D-alanine carboxypeptidase